MAERACGKGTAAAGASRGRERGRAGKEALPARVPAASEPGLISYGLAVCGATDEAEADSTILNALGADGRPERLRQNPQEKRLINQYP